MKIILIITILISIFGIVGLNRVEAQDSCTWEFLRNECTGCGVARSVEKNRCTSETRISAENVRDVGCDNENWCKDNNLCKNEFKYNECIACNSSRPVYINSCSGGYVIDQNQYDAACSSWCEQPESCPVNNSCCYQPLQKCTANGKDPSCPAGLQWCYAGFCVNENYNPGTDSCPGATQTSQATPVASANSNNHSGGSTSFCTNSLNGDLRSIINSYASVSGKPVWVTEVGFGTDDQNWQAQYLANIFNIFAQQNVPVVIWYGWNDSLTGGNGLNNWGLFDAAGNIKVSGQQFNQSSGI